MIGQEYRESRDVKILSLPLRQAARFVSFPMTGQDMERRVPGCRFEYGCYGIKRNCNPELADSLIFNFISEGPVSRNFPPCLAVIFQEGTGALP